MNSWPIEQKTYAKIRAVTDEQLTEVEDQLLCSFVDQLVVKPSFTVLEVNPYQGRSTIVLALASGNSNSVYCIDQWEHIYMNSWLNNLEQFNLSGVALPLRGEPLDVLRVMGPHLATKKIELVVLHGRQGLKEMLAIFATCFSFLQPGGKLVVHNTATSADYFNQFWEIASKIVHNPIQLNSFYYGVKS